VNFEGLRGLKPQHPEAIGALPSNSGTNRFNKSARVIHAKTALNDCFRHCPARYGTVLFWAHEPPQSKPNQTAGFDGCTGEPLGQIVAVNIITFETGIFSGAIGFGEECITLTVPAALDFRDADGSDPPPLKWSDLRYVFDIQENCNGKEAIQA